MKRLFHSLLTLITFPSAWVIPSPAQAQLAISCSELAGKGVYILKRDSYPQEVPLGSCILFDETRPFIYQSDYEKLTQSNKEFIYARRDVFY